MASSDAAAADAAAAAPPPAPAAATPYTHDFAGRRAFVTGAARGIGRCIAERLHACGADIVAVDISEAGLNDLKAALGGPARCATLVVDLGDAKAVVGAVEAANALTFASGSGGVELLVNCAGIAKFEPVFETSVEWWDKTFAINARATMLLSREVSKAFAAATAAGAGAGAGAGSGAGGKRRGAIVNISSQSSTIALLDHLTYSASKATVDHVTRIMAYELAPHGVRVNAVNPTVVCTALAARAWGEEGLAKMAKKVPLGRLAQPLDVANAVLFLLGDDSAMITGTMLPVDGGFLTGPPAQWEK